MHSDLIKQCCRLYRATLLEEVVPFWMRHGFDREYGGISNVVDDAGRALSRDKYLWSQGRALWTFSALYNRIEKRKEWLEFADHIFRYLAAHGRDEKGRWMYRLDQAGNIVERDISVYVDGFVMNGLSEYHLAVGSREALEIALQTYGIISTLLRTPESYRSAPYEIPPGLKAHGINMIFSFFFYQLGRVANRADIRAAGLQLGREILEQFYAPARDAIMEYTRLDSKSDDRIHCRTCVPGHAIESLWFLISMFEQEKNPARIRECCRLIRRHIELAWDEEHGGLKLALDIEGRAPPAWNKPDCKAWWVHVEALVATAFAHLHTRESWCLDWHQRIQKYSWEHFPVPTGEWTQWLDREGRKIESTALPVKDPFHLSRALIYLIDLFENRIEERKNKQ
ncbi:MAG: AGE family epimerase/isomerase [Lentisphaerae bacterium]|nr:AGE family epimerase/isomerase [Lentisphaerota bacterium]